MARIVLTNQKDYFDKLHAINSRYFKTSGLFEGDFYFSNYKKLNVDNENYLSFSDDFAASAGSFIYKNSTGREALSALYHDFRRLTIDEIRRNITGTYAIVVKLDNVIYVFVDETGNYALYYYRCGSTYLITNLMYHIGKATKTDVDIDALLEEMNEYCILDNSTFFKNTFRLSSNELIRVDTATGAFSVAEIKVNTYELKDKSFEGIVDTLSSTIKKYAQMQTLWGDSKTLFVTGGMDSRLTLAGDIAANYMPKLANWQGSPIYMNTKTEDKQVGENLSQALGLPFESIDVSGDVPHRITEDDFDRIGEYALIYGNNKKWHDFFVNTKDYLFDFGYFGETLKGWDPLEQKYHEGFSINDYTELYLHRQKHEYLNWDRKEAYIASITEKLRTICIQNEMDENDLSKENCMFLYYIYRTHADTKMVNFSNIYGYGFNLYAQKELADYINQIPYQYKDKGRLNLALTKKMCPQIIDIPYYSHCHYVTFNAERMTLESLQVNSIVSGIKRCIPSGMKQVIKCALGKDDYSQHIREVFKELQLETVEIEGFPKIGIHTYESVGEYKTYYDYYTMLKVIENDK